MRSVRINDIKNYKIIAGQLTYFKLFFDLISERRNARRQFTERSIMDDNKIIELLFERTESALEEVACKYSRLYKGIIREILNDDLDIDECANDVLLAVWNTIPPNRPNSLPAYVCKIARRIGIDKLRYNTSKKRNSGYNVMLSELEYCLPSEEDIEYKNESRETIGKVLSGFIRNLDPVTEVLFVRRYIYLESVAVLSKRFEMSQNKISVKLYRARKKLKKILEKEGIMV